MAQYAAGIAIGNGHRHTARLPGHMKPDSLRYGSEAAPLRQRATNTTVSLIAARSSALPS
ncbi:hypothetical protein [Roseiflexus castenholzii]|uniref:hypothetical protein n=1 Tax=Roseiflexus castenholzii TaxID=120962 RepID=UPI0002DD18BB|nr:hypothetical protein [Roseiflexus castenholzii]